MAVKGIGLLNSKSLPLVTVCEGAQALWWPCVAPTGSQTSVRRPKLFLLFIPGNPGLPSWYLDYLGTIHSHPQLRGHVEILAVGHLGHAPIPRTHEPQQCSTNLKNQVAHKVRIVDRIREMYPRSNGNTEQEVQFVLAGHSVGSYILLEVLKQRLSQLDGLHLLFPTVAHIGSAPNAGKIRVRLACSDLLIRSR